MGNKLNSSPEEKIQTECTLQGFKQPLILTPTNNTHLMQLILMN